MAILEHLTEQRRSSRIVFTENRSQPTSSPFNVWAYRRIMTVSTSSRASRCKVFVERFTPVLILGTGSTAVS